jgi:4-amino-4-deoxy-L-arabinose transferase-like glycosyltransferase
LTFDIPRVTFPRRALLTLLAAAAFLPFLGRRDVVTSHEARVVQTARAMAHSGWPWRATPVAVPAVRLGKGGHTGNMVVLEPDPNAPPLNLNPWLVPVLNDQIRLQKPPLPYWCTALAFRLFGVDWSEAAARLTPALLGFLSTFLVYALARRTLGRRFAFPAALVWTTTYFIPDEFRKVMADPFLAFFTLAALYTWIRAATPRASSIFHPPSSILVFYVFTALGLLAKGPALFIYLLPPLALYHLLTRRRGSTELAEVPPGRLWLHLLGFAILLTIAFPWPLYILNHIPNAWDMWYYESVGKVADDLELPRPIYYYLPLCLQMTLPWTPVWLLAFALPWIRRRRRGTQSAIRNPQSAIRLFPLAWFLTILVIFSLIRTKKLAYLLPVTPAVALMTAQALVYLTAARLSSPKSAVRLGRRKDNPAGPLLAAQTLIPLGFAIALFFLIPSTALPLTSRLVAALLPAALAAAAIRQLARRRTADWLILTSLASGLAAVAFINFVQTSAENARSPRLAAAYIDLALRADPTITTLPEKLPPEASLYLPLDLAFNPRAATLLYLLDDPKGRAATDLDAFAARLPDLHLTAVTPVPIPGDSPKHRYKLFALTLSPTPPKTLASAQGF